MKMVLSSWDNASYGYMSLVDRRSYTEGEDRLDVIVLCLFCIFVTSDAALLVFFI